MFGPDVLIPVKKMNPLLRGPGLLKKDELSLWEKGITRASLRLYSNVLHASLQEFESV